MNDAMNARWLRWCLTAIVLLLAIIAIELTALVNTGAVTARAEDTSSTSFPNTTRQRLELLDEQRRTTEELQRILTQLRRGTIKVQITSTDKEDASAGKTDAPRASAPAVKKRGG